MKSTIRFITSVLIFALIVSGCAPQYGSGWLANSEQVTHDGYGAWVRVKLIFSQSVGPTYAGELLAVSRDSLYIIDVASHKFQAMARADIAEVVGNTYDRGGYAVFGIEALAGCIVSIFTVGVFSVFTWLGYIISAIAGGSAASYISRVSYTGDPSDWRVLTTFSRFPTGLPPSYNRSNPKTKALVQQ